MMLIFLFHLYPYINCLHYDAQLTQSGSIMNVCWITFSVAWVTINQALGLPDPGLVEVQDRWKFNGTIIQPEPDEQRNPTNQQTHMHEVSDPKARKESSNTWSRCVKKNLINYVTEYENMMQCNVIYEQECHQVPKQVCSMTQINPKQIEKPYTQTICYNDNDDAEDVSSKIGGKLHFIFTNSTICCSKKIQDARIL